MEAGAQYWLLTDKNLAVNCGLFPAIEECLLIAILQANSLTFSDGLLVATRNCDSHSSSLIPV
jgi:hypothetical protein